MRNSHDLHGRHAVVTGGSSGLGRMLVRELVGRGARVAAIARDEGRLREALDGLGSAALPVPADLSRPAQVRAAFERIANLFGSIDFLLNNVGAGNWAPIDRIDDDEVQRQVAMNFLAAVHCTRAAIPAMRSAGGGVIINVSSESSQFPVAGLSLYGASKAALEAFSLAVNQELRADRIKSCVVRLGRMKDTGFSRGWDPALRAEAVERWQQEGRFAREGVLMETPVVAATIADMLSIPPAAQVRLLDLREFDAGV